MKKEFFTRDFIFNNGLVNLSNLIDKIKKDNDSNNDIINNIDIKLNKTSLELNFCEDTENKIFDEIYNQFISQYDIIYQTKNDRIYYNENDNNFIRDKKIDIISDSSNDKKNIYLKKEIKDLDYTAKDFKLKCEDYLKTDECQELIKNNTKENINNLVPWDKNYKSIILHTYIEKNIEKYKKYLFGEDEILPDSKLFSFTLPIEEGQFFDLCKISNSDKLNKWEALIYIFGFKVQRYFYKDFALFINSNSLISLQKFKKSLKIKDKPIEVKSKAIKTNLNIFDDRVKEFFANFNEEINIFEEFKLKFFIYLFSQKKDIEKRFLERGKKEDIYKALIDIDFVTYENYSVFKKSFDNYTKAYKIIDLFDKLNEVNINFSKKTLCNVFIEIFSIIKQIEKLNNKKEKDFIILKEFCSNILNFKDIRKILYKSSYQILSFKEEKNKEPINFSSENLYLFNKFYIQNILKGDYMEIHEISKSIGKEIGIFCANLEDKDLLFRLRNVKNEDQLISFFKDLEFKTLKEEDKEEFTEGFNVYLEDILSNTNNWERIRDYIAIYSIINFKKQIQKNTK